ncbi:M43 family zinc metalloprotease [Fulvivirga sediminis]|uniref:Peptidase M43 pregnancy-associated plasma-A domain-containing protein n=1 Tax=Fulvivirga sediminis TaxID=2803949 RepID=A0A937FD54_9BACT|nr:M43 family zinc metalloprotease [Fulvivirga sediminis]MBL3658725.1 hypothetical protein [Fulvivirga sediminis]
MKSMIRRLVLTCISLIIFSCSEKDIIEDSNELYILPVVVHIIHNGETKGMGNNLSNDRIFQQIETLNSDFRKKKGTLGYSNDPLAGDAKIEFRLAEIDPSGQPTNGITRVNAQEVEYDIEEGGWFFDYLPHYAYWDDSKYLNIWVFPFEPNIILGQASMPRANLPGLTNSDTTGTTGVMITTAHFGEFDVEGGSNLGRSLTHEMGHFLGLEHLWGKVEYAQCTEYDDYCKDTPYVSSRTGSCKNTSNDICDSSPVLIHNYMDYTDDICMNMFTHDQIRRMRFVIENSISRHLLTISPVISRN